VIRTLIADDEAPARARLRQLLAPHTDIEIVGEAESGAQVMELAAETKPDLLLLDIQMPGLSGVDVCARLSNPRPAIVFCTAFEEHAVDAFELAAVDYLLKPVSRARLAQALDRVRALGGAPEEKAPGLSSRGVSAPRRFLVKHGERYVVVHESRVLFFASEGGLTYLICDGGRYSMDPGLNQLEEQLEPDRFFRISRAALVNLSAVAELLPLPGGSGEAVMKNGQRLEVSRRRFRDLLHALPGDSRRAVPRQG
jgi:two-component system LytT family response regulator